MTHRNLPKKTSDIQKNPDPSRDIVAGMEQRAIGIIEFDTPNNSHNTSIIPHYEFPFFSGSSRLSHAEKKLIQDYLGKNTVKVRMYCIRHGMSTQEKEGRELQTDDATLCDDAKVQYKGIAEALKKSGIHEKNTCLLYSEGTRKERVIRVIESANILIQEIGIPPHRIRENIDGIDTTDKDDDIDTRRKLRTAADTSHFTAELQSALRLTPQNINIICVIHKSNIASIEETLLGQGKHNISLNARGMKTGDIAIFDFKNHGECVDYDQDKNLLKLNLENYESFLEIFRQESGLQRIISKFDRQTIQLWELQNYINAYCVANKDLYSKYLYCNIIELRIFCLANLIAEENYSVIEEYYLSDTCTSISSDEKNLILKYANQHLRISGLIQKLFILRPKFWRDEDQAYIEKELGSDFYNRIKKNRESYISAIDLQGVSLDAMIAKRQEGAILDRDVKFFQKIEMGSAGKSRENVQITTNFEQILLTGEKYILRAHVGQGKTLWITELVKHASQMQKQVFFYKAKDLGMKRREQLEELFSQIPKGAILCIDGIDETHFNKKDTLKQLIDSYQGTCIITARESEYPEENNGYITLSLVPIDATQFLKSRFHEDSFKLLEVLKILKKIHLDTEVMNNPLLLNLVVLLTQMKDEDIKEYDGLGIKCLENIQNQADLYESVIRFILTKHAKETKGQAYTSRDLQNWMDELGRYAFYLYPGNKESKQDEYYDEHLSILFRNLGTHQYEFIHHSFYEYFLARYLVNTSDEDQGIFKLKTTEKLKTRNDFNLVAIFYGELLVNNGNIDALEKFLEGIGLTGIDTYNDVSPLGLEILMRIENNKKINPSMVTRIHDIFLEEIRGWDFFEDFCGFRLFTSIATKYTYSKANSVSLTMCINRFFRKILEEGGEKFFDSKSDFLYEIANLGGKKQLDYVWQELEKLRVNDHESYLQCSKVYALLIEVGYVQDYEDFETIEEYIYQIISKEENRQVVGYFDKSKNEVRLIVKALIKVGYINHIDSLIQYSYMMPDEYRGYTYDFFEISDIRELSTQEIVEKYGKNLMSVLMDFLGDFLADGSPVRMNQVMDLAQEIYKHNTLVYLDLLTIFAIKNTPSHREYAMKIMQILVQKGADLSGYESRADIYSHCFSDIVFFNRKLAFEGIDTLITERCYRYAEYNLLNILNKDQMNVGKYAFDIWERINKLRHSNKKEIYEKLLSLGISSLTKVIVQDIKLLPEDEQIALVRSLIHIGNIEINMIAYDLGKTLMKEKEYTEALDIFSLLTVHSEIEDVFQLAIVCIDNIDWIQKKDNHNYYWIIFSLARIGEKSSFAREKALEWIFSAIQSKDHPLNIYSILFQILPTGDRRLLDATIFVAEKLMNIKEYNKSLCLVQRLLEFGYIHIESEKISKIMSELKKYKKEAIKPSDMNEFESVAWMKKCKYI